MACVRISFLLRAGSWSTARVCHSLFIRSLDIGFHLLGRIVKMLLWASVIQMLLWDLAFHSFESVSSGVSGLCGQISLLRRCKVPIHRKVGKYRRIWTRKLSTVDLCSERTVVSTLVPAVLCEFFLIWLQLIILYTVDPWATQAWTAWAHFYADFSVHLRPGPELYFPYGF